MRNTYTSRSAYQGQRLASIPYMGLTAAGFPKDSAACPGEIIQFPLNAKKGKSADYFFLKAKGTSMTKAGINDGDFILLRKAETPENGAIMLIRHETQTTVKRVRIRDGKVLLCWEDGSQRQLEVDSSDYEIQGKFIKAVYFDNGKHSKVALG